MLSLAARIMEDRESDSRNELLYSTGVYVPRVGWICSGESGVCVENVVVCTMEGSRASTLGRKESCAKAACGFAEGRKASRKSKESQPEQITAKIALLIPLILLSSNQQQLNHCLPADSAV